MKDKTGGPAYPHPQGWRRDPEISDGMTLRDRAAIAALQSILTWEGGCSKRDDETYEQAKARLAFDYADAWLAERAKREQC